MLGGSIDYLFSAESKRSLATVSQSLFVSDGSSSIWFFHDAEMPYA